MFMNIFSYGYLQLLLLSDDQRGWWCWRGICEFLPHRLGVHKLKFHFYPCWKPVEGLLYWWIVQAFGVDRDAHNAVVHIPPTVQCICDGVIDEHLEAKRTVSCGMPFMSCYKEETVLGVGYLLMTTEEASQPNSEAHSFIVLMIMIK